MRFGKHNPGEAAPPVEQPPTQEQAKRLATVERARENLHGAINAYRSILGETRLSSALTQNDKNHRMEVFYKLNEYAGGLNSRNAEEGTMVLSITSLNSILKISDDVNDLKFQNTILHSRIKKLESKQEGSSVKTTMEE